MEWLKKLFEPSVTTVPFDYGPSRPEMFGSIIAANGQPGSGKTLLLYRLVAKAGYRYRLPVVIQDTRNDVHIYHEQAIRDLEKENTEIARSKLKFLKDRSRFRFLTSPTGESFISTIAAYERESRRETNRRPKFFTLIDEGGVLRRGDESLWDIAAGFRNIGGTAYTSVHKDTDISRVGRQCLRAVILQRPYEGDVEFFGVTINAMDCSPPASNLVTYIDSYSRQLHRFDMSKEEPPEILLHPVQPTKVSKVQV